MSHLAAEGTTNKKGKGLSRTKALPLEALPEFAILLSGKMMTLREVATDLYNARRGRYKGESWDWNEGYQTALECVLGFNNIIHTDEGNLEQREFWEPAAHSSKGALTI